MDNLYWLEHIQPSDRTLVGDKAFQLSRVVQRGYPVLPGFVVSVQALFEFIQSLNGNESLVADLPHSSLHLDVDNPRQLQRVAQRLRQEIITAPLPSEWVATISAAVERWETPALIFRPSLVLPTATYRSLKTTGLLEAQVCTCDQEAMALALKQTWSQLFRARSLLYWQRAGIGLQQINLAVLVQPIANAIASGYLTYNQTELEIQASWGLGMAIARGEVLPDSYFVQPKTGAVRLQQLGNKTLAYNLVNSPLQADFTPCPTPLLSQTSESCLQTYLLELAQQQQYALKEKHLQQLIQLAQQLRSELGSAFTLQWTLPQAEDSETTQVYLTQVTTLLSPSPPLPLAPSPHLPLAPSAHSIRGLPAAVGRVMAPAHVITNSSQKPETLLPGVILVAPAIAPDWLPLLQQAAGVVTEQGGLTSHSAILARELGIPAVVSAANATQLIQTGDSVLVDGDRGEIYRVSEGERFHSAVGDGEIGRWGENNANPPSPPQHQLSQRGEPPHETRSPLTPSSMTSHVPIATQLPVNLSQTNLIEQIKRLQ